MTNLGCCVENCVHNEDNMCCRGNIKVDGHKAHDAGETCCASFQDCGCHGATNSTRRPNAKIEVACDASNCMYNNNMMCSAGHGTGRSFLGHSARFFRYRKIVLAK